MDNHKLPGDPRTSDPSWVIDLVAAGGNAGGVSGGVAVPGNAPVSGTPASGAGHVGTPAVVSAPAPAPRIASPVLPTPVVDRVSPVSVAAAVFVAPPSAAPLQEEIVPVEDNPPAESLFPLGFLGPTYPRIPPVHEGYIPIGEGPQWGLPQREEPQPPPRCSGRATLVPGYDIPVPNTPPRNNLAPPNSRFNQ